MKTLVEHGTVVNGHHIVKDDYEVGELSRNKIVELRKLGYNVQQGQLCGRFNGVRTFVDFLTENGGKFGSRTPEKDDSSHEISRGDDWVKYRTFEKCVEAVRSNPEDFRDFKEADIKLTEYESNGNDVDYNTVGDFIDIGRVMSGEPECFGTMRNGNVIKRFANITVNGNHAHWVSRRWIDKKAQRIARLVDFLEASNVRVKLTVLFTNNNSHLELIVKQYNDRLDINDVCISISPDFFRRFEFYWSEHSKCHELSYGRAESISLDQVREEDVDLNLLVGSEGHASVDDKFDRLEKIIAEEGLETPKEHAVLV